MPALILNILKILFLILIFLFLWQVALAIRSHIGTGPSSKRSKGGRRREQPCVFGLPDTRSVAVPTRT